METLQRTANRGSISTGYQIKGSVIMDESVSTMDTINQTMKPGGDNGWSAESNAGTNAKKLTVSLWFKRSQFHVDNTAKQNWLLAFVAGGNVLGINLIGDHVKCYDDLQSFSIATSRQLLDCAAWYHLVVAVDASQGTASNRVKIYINGVQETALTNSAGNGAADYGDDANLTPFRTANTNIVIGGNGGNNAEFNGYIADLHFIDGAQKAASDFGEFDEDSGIWVAKEYEDDFGNLGGRWDFVTLKTPSGKAEGYADLSGNDNVINHNNEAREGIICEDSPQNNFCTLMKGFDPIVGSHPVHTQGLTIATGGASGQQDSHGTMAVARGKWYFEWGMIDIGGIAIGNMFGGISKESQLIEGTVSNAANGFNSHDGGWGSNVTAIGFHDGDASSGFTSQSGGALDSVQGVAFDMDNGKIWFHIGGVYTLASGTAGNPTNGTLAQFTNLLTQYPTSFVVPSVQHYVNQATVSMAVNFGNPTDNMFTDVGSNSDGNGYGSFAYAPPTGFYSLCTKNLAEYG